MSSIVRRTPPAPRALAPRAEVPLAPRVLTLDADSAVMLALDATRGMLEACLRGEEPRASAQQAAPVDEPDAPLAEAGPSGGEACPAWRATQVRRAYLSTLPPPPGDPPPSCDRWA